MKYPEAFAATFLKGNIQSVFFLLPETEGFVSKRIFLDTYSLFLYPDFSYPCAYKCFFNKLAIDCQE